MLPTFSTTFHCFLGGGFSVTEILKSFLHATPRQSIVTLDIPCQKCLAATVTWIGWVGQWDGHDVLCGALRVGSHCLLTDNPTFLREKETECSAVQCSVQQLLHTS